jgi:hypothetical protein
MPYTSEARQNAYDYILWMSRHRIITPAQFAKEKTKIDRREARSVALKEAKRLKKEAEATARREARKAETAKRNKDKAEAKKRQVLSRTIPANLLRQKYTAEHGDERDVRAMWKLTQGVHTWFIGGEIDGGVNAKLTAGYNDKDYKSFRQAFTNGSDGFRFVTGDVFLLLTPTQNTAERMIQRFRDGIHHCVFVPLIDKLKKSIDDASPATKKRLLQRIKKLNMMSIMYASGVPEDKMDEVVGVSGLKLTLCDIFKGVVAVYNNNGRCGSIVGTNGRENHIDIGVIIDSDHIELDQDQMNTLWEQVKSDYAEKKEYYRIDGDFIEGIPSKICTLKGAWRVKNPIQEACNQLDKELGIINYKINAVKQPELNEFLRAGRIINSWSTILNDVEATACADMPSAYAQFKKCHMYAGFLGHIHQFRSGSFSEEFVEEHLGYYKIIVRGGVDWLSEKLGMYVGLETVLFSPELLYFMKNGLEVDIVQGAWGSRFDFDFPDYMMEDIIIKSSKYPEGKKERPYCHWSGRLGIERHETSHTIPASAEWASHLSVEHKVYYWKEQGLVTIKKPVKQCFTAHHILGALTSYVRIQMMEAMKMFEPSNLVRIVLDGIYYRGAKPTGLDWFKDKKVKINDSSSPWYEPQEVPVAPPLCNIVGNALLTGQGGAGKTYSVFKNPGFNTILYVSPSHILGHDVRDKYGATYTTIHKLIGIDCRPYRDEFRIPPVIFVDEITQIDSTWVDKVFEMYPESLILLAGDIDSSGRWFQCRSGSGDEWNTIWKPHGVDVIEYLDDRRSRDEELKSLKLLIRRMMKQCDLDAGLYQMEEWANRKLPISKFEFVPGDTCIAGTHRTNAKLLSLGVVSGYYKKGGAVSDVELPGYEKRGSFTIHSYQGKTIESGNVWIFIDDLFEYAMLYTAVSRAVNMSQIKFVRSRDL